jgi:Holliday junction resolvasome RuvABC endonuclease subunit
MLLCLDPGFSNFGYSVMDQNSQVIDIGTVQTKKTNKKLLRVADDDVQRITYITSQLSKIATQYDIQGVLAELPPSNSQSAAAAKGLGIAVALTAALFTELNIPIEWATPDEVKRANTGKKNASKEDMMLAACKRYDWKISNKTVVYSKSNFPKVCRVDSVYHPLGRSMGKNQFEHIADSLGAFEALKHTNTARSFLKKL